MPDRAISDLTMASKSVGTGPPPVLPIFGGRILLLDERRRRPGVVGPSAQSESSRDLRRRAWLG
jgi:hypothetical protein